MGFKRKRPDGTVAELKMLEKKSMAMTKADFGELQANTVLAAAIPNRVLLIERVVFSTDKAARMRLLSDPGGPGAENLTPWIYLAAGQTLDLRLGRAFGVATARGKSLGLTSDGSIPESAHSIVVWYEAVE